MDKLIANTICLFVPNKDTRRNIRAYFGRKKFSPLQPLARFVLPRMLPAQYRNAIVFQYQGGLADQIRTACFAKSVYENWRGEKPDIIFDVGKIYRRPDKFITTPRAFNDSELQDLLKSQKREYDASGKKLISNTFELCGYEIDWSWTAGYVCLPSGWKSKYDLFGRQYVIFDTQKNNPLTDKKNIAPPLYVRAYPKFDLFEEAAAQDFLKSMTAKMTGKNAEKLSEIKNTPHSICLHIRRGDYIAHSQGKSLPADYFERSVKKIIDTTGWKDVTLFVFSDDWEWSREAINFEFDGVETTIDFVNINDISNPIPELELMRTCKHFVISAGNFARMATQMSGTPDKIVIMPSDSDFVKE